MSVRHRGRPSASHRCGYAQGVGGVMTRSHDQKSLARRFSIGERFGFTPLTRERTRKRWGYAPLPPGSEIPGGRGATSRVLTVTESEVSGKSLAPRSLRYRASRRDATPTTGARSTLVPKSRASAL